MAGEGGKNMSMAQFTGLISFIMEHHSQYQGVKSHCIKYVRPHFDTRTGDFFSISFDGIRGFKRFSVTNENRHRDLTAWIMEFLNTPPDEAGWEERDENGNR